MCVYSCIMEIIKDDVNKTTNMDALTSNLENQLAVATLDNDCKLDKHDSDKLELDKPKGKLYELNNDKFVIGLIDLGEKDYLTRCIHDGTFPVSRMDNFSYYILCFDEKYNPIDYRFEPVNAALLLDKIENSTVVVDNKMNNKINNETNNKNLELTSTENTTDTNEMFKSTDLTFKNDKYNEMIYSLRDLPDTIQVISIYIFKFDEIDKKYVLYLIDPTNNNIYKNFYLPDYSRTATSTDEPIFLCSFIRDNTQSSNWTAYFLDDNQSSTK